MKNKELGIKLKKVLVRYLKIGLGKYTSSEVFDIMIRCERLMAGKSYKFKGFNNAYLVKIIRNRVIKWQG